MNNGKNSIQEITLEQMAKVSGGTVDTNVCPRCGQPYGEPGNHTCRKDNILSGPLPIPQPIPIPVPVPVPVPVPIPVPESES